VTISTDSRFCSLCARQAGLSPAGHGGATYELIIAAELPLPWPRLVFGERRGIPAELLAVMAHIREEYARNQSLRILPQGIAPDPDYSVPGMRRVIRYRGWSGLPAPFLQVLERELLVRHGWA
jgi:hypothetical protein